MRSCLSLRFFLLTMVLFIGTNSFAQNPFAVKFKLTGAWTNSYNADIIIINQSANASSTWNLGMTMLPTVNNVWSATHTASGTTHTFTNLSYNGVINPGDSVSFGMDGTFQGTHLIPPTTCTINGTTQNLIWVNVDTCQTPSPYYLSAQNYKSTGEIHLGQARLFPVWGVSVDALIPVNRISWAISLVHANQVFRNITGIDKYPINTYFATSLKESFCGCDPGIQTSSNYPYPFSYQASSIIDGCFQIESNSAYAELSNMYPQRFPAGMHPQIVGGRHYETAALTKAYYDIFTIKYLDKAKNWDPIGFFAGATDSLAAVKAICGAYNRGLWSKLVDTIFHSGRANALAAPDLLQLFAGEPVAKDYSEQITNYTLALGNHTAVLNPSLTAINTATGTPYNQFYQYYDTLVSWQHISNYIDTIAILYQGVNLTTVKNRVHNTFNSMNNGQPVSFRYQMGQVIDTLLMALPVDDPSCSITAAYTTNIQQSKPHEEKQWSVYPNPTAGNFNIEFSSPNNNSPVQLCIFNNLGELVQSEIFSANKDLNKKTINTNLPTGIYLIQLKLNQNLYTKKLISTN